MHTTVSETGRNFYSRMQRDGMHVHDLSPAQLLQLFGNIPLFLLQRSVERESNVKAVIEASPYRWLASTSPSETFAVARTKLDTIFPYALIEEFGIEECLGVLDRTEQIACELKRRLQNTNLFSQENSVTDNDVAVLTRAMEDIAPHVTGNSGYSYPTWDERNNIPVKPQSRNFPRSVVPHVKIARILAEKLIDEIQGTKRFGNIDRVMIALALQLHDLGRWITHHQDVHDDIVALIFHSIGLREDIANFEYHYHQRYDSGKVKDVDAAQIPFEQLVFYFADWFGKRMYDGNPNDPSEENAHLMRGYDDLEGHIIRRAKQYATDMPVQTIQDAFHYLPEKQRVYYVRELQMLRSIFAFWQDQGVDVVAVRERVIETLRQQYDSGVFLSRTVSRLDEPLSTPIPAQLSAVPAYWQERKNLHKNSAHIAGRH